MTGLLSTQTDFKLDEDRLLEVAVLQYMVHAIHRNSATRHTHTTNNPKKIVPQ